VRIGAYLGRQSASIEVGNPGFPELRGKETGAELLWRIDTRDSPVVPSRGLLSEVRLSRVFNGPDVAVGDQRFDVASSLTQLSAAASRFWSAGPQNRLFMYGGVGTSFDTNPLPTDQFALGTPFRLVAYRAASSWVLTTTSRQPAIFGESDDCRISWVVPCSRVDGSIAGNMPAGERTVGPGSSWTPSSAPLSWPAPGASTDAGAPTWASAECSAESAWIVGVSSMRRIKYRDMLSERLCDRPST
jgi:hypothetical protein